jgi:hypothetical protein
MCEDFAQNFGDKRTGCCIITTHRLTNITVVPHPFHSSPFPRLKTKVKGRHFDTTEVMEAESQAVLNTTSRMHLKMAEALGTVHTHERRLFEGNGGQ